MLNADVPIIGLDIGTTETKCSLLALGKNISTIRAKTPIVKNVGKERYSFSPYEIWQVVQSLLCNIKKQHNLRRVIISVVSQAPSICMWSEKNVERAVGVSYLSYYGDPKQNNRTERVFKMKRRLDFAKELYSSSGPSIISGINGFIVYMLTNCVSVDSVTAWEMGIESQETLRSFETNTGCSCLAEIVSPLKRFQIKNGLFTSGSTAIAGTTDSAILPLSTGGHFSNYYVYMGTWGSLLKTRINCENDYNTSFFSGDLHSWIISIPDFIQKVSRDSGYLEEFFSNLSKNIQPNSTVSICGGLSIKYEKELRLLCKHHLSHSKIFFSSDADSINGACMLGALSMKGGELSEKDH